MRTRPVIRWKSFWFGILVLGFLGWAWWDSTRIETLLTVPPRAMKLGVYRMGGASYFVHGTHVEGYWRGVPRVSAAELEENLKSVEAVRPGMRHVKVPDALVLVAWLALWGGWLVWRWRVARRMS
jgi:hypothetical protein